MSTLKIEPRHGERVAYSPAEFAAAIGCTRQHVQNLIARGELPSFKLGARRFIPANVLDELEAQALGVSQTAGRARPAGGDHA